LSAVQIPRLPVQTTPCAKKPPTRRITMNTLVIFSLGVYHLTLFASAVYIRLYWADFPPPGIWQDVALWGLAGGCVYCMRSLYIHHCVKQDWSNRWCMWHLFRPFVSAICGVASLLFVKAGLLLFGISSAESSYNYGVYALSFVAGLNVDNFIKKVESTFKEIAGIRKSRISEEK